MLRPDAEPDQSNRSPEVDSYWGREVVLKVGLCVVRKFDDGSVVIAYKLLKNFDIPHDPRDLRSGRTPRLPRKLPTTRVP